MRGSWSKYGGGRRAPRHSHIKGWVCQVCSSNHDSKDIPYMAELLPGEHFKTCGSCASLQFNIYVEKTIYMETKWGDRPDLVV